MDKSFMIFVALGMGFLYFVTTFIGGIQEEDDAYRNKDYNQERQYDQYQSVDSIGQGILDLTGTDSKTQLGAWNSSMLKEEFLDLFPRFDEMKDFTKDRIRGKILQDKLTQTLNTIEDGFFSGTMDSEQAKRMLSELK